MLLPEIARQLGQRPLIHVALDDQRLAALAEQLAFFAPELEVLRFPAWDCLPYDRVSPAAEIVARRLATLSRLVQPVGAAADPSHHRQCHPAARRAAQPDRRRHLHRRARPAVRACEKLLTFLANNGFSRTGTVVDPGDFAVRGGIVDIFPPGAEAPVRLDFFGDTLESIRSFDPQSQRSTGTLKRVVLHPANEVLLTPEAIGRFRTAYAAAFGGLDISDPLYESVTSGRRYQGMEHWLPLVSRAPGNHLRLCAGWRGLPRSRGR